MSRPPVPRADGRRDGAPTLTSSCAFHPPSLSPRCARAAVVVGGPGGCEQCGEEQPSEGGSSCF